MCPAVAQQLEETTSAKKKKGQSKWAQNGCSIRRGSCLLPKVLSLARKGAAGVIFPILLPQMERLSMLREQQNQANNFPQYGFCSEKWLGGESKSIFSPPHTHIVV